MPRASDMRLSVEGEKQVAEDTDSEKKGVSGGKLSRTSNAKLSIDGENEAVDDAESENRGVKRGRLVKEPEAPGPRVKMPRATNLILPMEGEKKEARCRFSRLSVLLLWFFRTDIF